MADRTREAGKEQRPTTVLDPLRPAVVVRRRVYDATAPAPDAEAPRAFTAGAPKPARVDEDDEESGPPSSIDVARALASLRGDELQRVEELVRADEAREEEGEAEEAPAFDVASARTPEAAPPSRPTLTLGKSVALSELAARMGVSAQELPAALVARGFYALDAKAVVPRHTARTIAELHGFQVEDSADGPDDSAPSTRSVPRSRIATKRKVGTKSKPKVKAKRKAVAAAKPAKRRLAR
jgi:hypothetical protein